MNFLAATGESGMGIEMLIFYVIFIGGMMYFMIFRPQKKQKQKQTALYANLAIGDTVLTSSGFYGVLIDITDDTVIVEFGNNKNCRIPMQKAAIVDREAPGIE